MTRTRSVATRFFMGLVAIFVLISGVHAQDETLESFHLTAFSKRDGAPGVGSLAQTPDGYLWIAGNEGLTRFDGRSFSKFQPLPGESFPEANLGKLEPAEGGGLWVASNFGVSLVKDGHITNFGSADGYIGTRGFFFTDRAGHVWSHTTAGLMRFEDGAWKVKYRAESGHLFVWACSDGGGNLWAIIDRHLALWPSDQSGFIDVTGGPDGAQRIFCGSSGRIYVETRTEVHFYQHRGIELVESAKPVPVWAYQLIEARDGSIWMGSFSHGIYYISGNEMAAAEAEQRAPRSQSMTQADGLMGNYAPILLQDREGDIWVNSEKGLNRFRRAAFTQIRLPDGIHTVSALADKDGNLWVGSENEPLLVRSPSGDLKEAGLPPATLTLASDALGDRLWAVTREGIWRLRPGAPQIEKPFIPGQLKFLGVPPCLLREKGEFYLCMAYNGVTHGLLKSGGDQWSEVFDHPVLPKVIASDKQGAVWVGSHDNNRLYRLANGSEARFDERDGLTSGVITAIYADAGGDGLWVGGSKGLQYFDGKHFRTLATDAPGAGKSIAGLVFDRHGNLWAQWLDGVLRFRAADVAAFKAGATKPMHADLFGDEDNVSGSPDTSWTNPNLKLGPDGRIWVQTSTALAWVDPDHLPADPVRPVVVIENVETSKHAYPFPAGALRVTPDENMVRISFTAPSLSRPERTTLRYRLVGMSDQWMDARDRRDATYTNLAPGSYRFEVEATNGDGLTSARIGSISFQRLPAYYETWWFRVLWVLPVVLIVWLIQEVRSRALARRLKIQSDERERIARELHDTFLQAVQGLMLRFQSAMERIPTAEPARKLMERALDHADEVIVEGRDRVTLLRAQQHSRASLESALMQIGEDFARDTDITFRFTVEGTPRPLDPGASDEILQLAREAIANAFRHAKASHIDVSVTFEEKRLALDVVDDGRGFDVEAIARNRPAGHWGLQGMHERAANLHARLVLSSRPGAGTALQLAVPGVVAYPRRWKRWRWELAGLRMMPVRRDAQTPPFDGGES